MTVVFFPKEHKSGESRVSATPGTVKRLKKEGFRVLIESGAGVGSCFSDGDYEKLGAEIVKDVLEGFRSADLVVSINTPRPDQVKNFKKNSSLISFLYLHQNPQILQALKERCVSVFAMEAIPRTTRAQKFDALSSQNNLAGYQAALIAAVECPKLFPLMMTAAGTLRPARVVVLGAGVAGLQATATAKRLGAIVEVSDIRPAVKEQVESLGAIFIEVPTDENMEDEGGYAKEASEDFLKRQAEITKAHIIRADAVITSALVPGKKAPVLISEDTVKEMRQGSVIVDMAAEQGGNCSLTVPGETIISHGVKIVGPRNLAAQVPLHASESYAANVLGIILEQLDKEKKFAWNLEDDVVQGALIVRDGELQNKS